MPDSSQAADRHRWTRSRYRALLREHGPASAQFRTRIAILAGAVAIGVVATLFARISDQAGNLFKRYADANHWWPLASTPLAFVLVVWLTRRFAPLARGSGIPQVIAARENPEQAMSMLISVRTAVAKAILTVLAVLNGASVGREGPTVQLAAAVMGLSHRVLRVPLRTPVVIAGGAAGVAAAFNTPLAGLLFAIEELASAYEQRVTLLVVVAIVIAGMVAQTLQGDYVYFGAGGGAHLHLAAALGVVPATGILGGLTGGFFSRLLLGMAKGGNRFVIWGQSHPLILAGICGVVVASLGVTTGLSWGTGYGPARAMIDGANAPYWFGPAKFLSTLVTAVAGLPGGIFAPSLAVGAGLGNLLRSLFPDDAGSAIVLLGMVGYFSGVVRAPLTAVIILSETTSNRGLLLPMFATAFIADAVSQWVCREKLYHGLSRSFAMTADDAPPHEIGPVTNPGPG